MGTKQAKLEQIKDGIHKSTLSEEEKTNAYKHVEEWFLEDQADGIVHEKIIEEMPFLQSIFAELGFI